jgi:glutamate racemase
MKDKKPVFVADTCIGGLSVVKSMWKVGTARDAIFLADYAVNPLGVKDDSEITNVVGRWLRFAEEHSDTLVIACNTLSIRYHQLHRSEEPSARLERIVTMVDCLEAMVNLEADRLSGSKILVIGTEFTASQHLYPDILAAALPGARAQTVAATKLERNIARLHPWNDEDKSVLTDELRQAIASTDIAILACTCFPLVRARLESLFPDVLFLDPGAYCAGRLKGIASAQDRKLHIKVTGDVVSAQSAANFARPYLGEGSIVSS